MSECIKVVVRVRPAIERENELSKVVNVNGNQVVVHATNCTRHRTISCKFDKVLGENATQEDAFAATIRDNVDHVLDGFNCTVMAYGQTGTGKTFTILGESEGPQQGILSRAATLLFDKLSSPENNLDAKVYCSYLQIYNEKLFDLLQDQQRQFPLKLRNNNSGAFVQGLSEIRVSSVKDIRRVLERGAKSRSIRSTEYNEASSRSHAILQLRVESEQSGSMKVFKSAKLNFVDLAGSEKLNTVHNICSNRENELKHINQSLSCLGNVIHALGQSSRTHIPYRDSKLTHLLQDSLGGNTKMTVICTLSPSMDSIEDSVSTLQFADRAKQVMVTVTTNQIVDDSVLLVRAQAEIARLKRLLRERDMPADDGDLRAQVAHLKQINHKQMLKIEKLVKQKMKNTTKMNDSSAEKAPESETSFENRFENNLGTLEIADALREELDQNDDDFLLPDPRMEVAFESAEKECIQDLRFEMSQLENIQQERLKLENALRLLTSKPANKTSKEAKVERRDLSFSEIDVGIGLLLYQCRVDAWFEVDIVNYDSKSGMHQMRYRNEGGNQWHQMAGRRYKFIDQNPQAALSGVCKLKVSAKKIQNDRNRKVKLKKAITKSSVTSSAMETYGVSQRLFPAMKIKTNTDTENNILKQLHSEGLSYRVD